MDTKTDRSIALALHWARNNAGEHADIIIEALAAYDPERVGARTVAKPAQGAVEALADTQRAIIEAAEARGYERAKCGSERDYGGIAITGQLALRDFASAYMPERIDRGHAA